jgi:hypothetical protein
LRDLVHARDEELLLLFRVVNMHVAS